MGRASLQLTGTQPCLRKRNSDQTQPIVQPSKQSLTQAQQNPQAASAGRNSSRSPVRTSSRSPIRTAKSDLSKSGTASLEPTKVKTMIRRKSDFDSRHPDAYLLSSLEGPAVIATVAGVLQS